MVACVDDRSAPSARSWNTTCCSAGSWTCPPRCASQRKPWCERSSAGARVSPRILASRRRLVSRPPGWEWSGWVSGFHCSVGGHSDERRLGGREQVGNDLQERPGHERSRTSGRCEARLRRAQRTHSRHEHGPGLGQRDSQPALTAGDSRAVVDLQRGDVWHHLGRPELDGAHRLFMRQVAPLEGADNVVRARRQVLIHEPPD